MFPSYNYLIKIIPEWLKVWKFQLIGISTLAQIDKFAPNDLNNENRNSTTRIDDNVDFFVYVMIYSRGH